MGADVIAVRLSSVSITVGDAGGGIGAVDEGGGGCHWMRMGWSIGIMDGVVVVIVIR